MRKSFRFFQSNLKIKKIVSRLSFLNHLQMIHSAVFTWARCQILNDILKFWILTRKSAELCGRWHMFSDFMCCGFLLTCAFFLFSSFMILSAQSRNSFHSRAFFFLLDFDLIYIHETNLQCQSFLQSSFLLSEKLQSACDVIIFSSKHFFQCFFESKKALLLLQTEMGAQHSFSTQKIENVKKKTMKNLTWGHLRFQGHLNRMLKYW